jgi:hypothetical protein
MLRPSTWETAAGVALVASATVCAVLWFRRKRPTAEEIEFARRTLLSNSGRIVDGMMLDVCEMDAADGRKLTLLVYSYRIGGVDYECSQDITNLAAIVDPKSVHLGFPCSVRYLPRNPQNSIVISEVWTGLREGLPQLPVVGPSIQDKSETSRTIPG